MFVLHLYTIHRYSLPTYMHKDTNSYVGQFLLFNETSGEHVVLNETLCALMVAKNSQPGATLNFRQLHACEFS